MGKSIEKTEFTPADYERFQQRLHDNLVKLEEIITTPGFGAGPASFGAELELYAINDKGLPEMCNQAIQHDFQDERLTLELNRYNLEYNLSPVTASGRPFSALRKEMETALEQLDQIAGQHQASIIPIGILPTLTTDNLGMHAITDLPRYHVLAKALRDRRGSDFHIRISGEDELDLHWGDVTPEGANTSFQFHYRVAPEHFTDAFNAAQLITPLGVALAANSPFFLGKKLWHETRVALFKQAIDCRMGDSLSQRLPPRVYFGNGWVRRGAYELFSEGIYLFPPLFPQCKDTDSQQNNNPNHQGSQNRLSKRGLSENRGNPPELYELCLHHGSIWTWNRPIYDPAAGGHLRIELRALPAGPTPVDMLATAAFSIGLIEGLSKQINSILPGIPFRYAEHNFYRAAKDGLNSKLFWPNFDANSIEERPVTDILEELMPVAETGLRYLRIADDEIKTYLDIANNTMASRQNGAIWQQKTLRRLEQGTDKLTAFKHLVQSYQRNYLDGTPVHLWR